jgi:hypothetical protein
MLKWQREIVRDRIRAKLWFADRFPADSRKTNVRTVRPRAQNGGSARFPAKEKQESPAGALGG